MGSLTLATTDASKNVARRPRQEPAIALRRGFSAPQAYSGLLFPSASVAVAAAARRSTHTHTMASLPVKKVDAEEATYHKIRITLTSRNVKSLEKGMEINARTHAEQKRELAMLSPLLLRVELEAQVWLGVQLECPRYTEWILLL